jgi:geranylgeranyl pyrophosphate synthase
LWAILAFSLGVLLTPEECKLVQPLTDLANRIFVQTNDYFSWEIEKKFEKDRIFNTVLCLMTENHIPEEQAKALLKSYIIHDEMMYQAMLDRFDQANPRISIHLQKYIAAGTLFVAGNHHWSAICPRYNLPEALDKKQVLAATVKMEEMVVHSEVKDPAIDYCTLNAGTDKYSIAQARNETVLDNTALLAAPRYIQSLPSKNIRSKLLDAFNIWFELPKDRASIIKGVVDDLHNATLILDDIQDESILRRGHSAAHCVFGSAQCINSATYMVVQASAKIHELYTKTPQAMGVFIDGLSSLSIGQSWDLNWKFNSYCPSINEYMAMIDGKTGAMFKMLVRLMQCMSSLPTGPTTDFDRFTQLLGRWYQVRDDFQNLQDPEYTEQKGFCEDLDEGKLSYPVVMCCNSDPVARAIILGIFKQNENGTPLARSVKMQILDLLRKSGALKETWQILQQLEKEVEDALSTLETVLGKPNPSLRLITKLLSDIPPP